MPPVTTAELDDDEIKALIGEGELETGTPAPDKPEPGKGDTPKDDATGTLDGDPADEQDDGDDDPKWKAERKAKKALERRLQRQVKETSSLREELRRQSELLNALTSAELERRTGSVDASVEAARSRLKKAIDDGDADGQVEAQGALADAMEQARAAKNLVRQVKEARPAPEREPEPEPNDLAEEWMADRPWLKFGTADKDSQFVAKTSDYIETVMGIPPNDPAHFKELDRIIARDLPHRAPKAQRRAEDRDLPATAGTGRPATGQAGLNPKIPAELRAIADQITRADVALYKNAGLDWANPDHQEEILRYKNETVQKQRAQRRA